MIVLSYNNFPNFFSYRNQTVYLSNAIQKNSMCYVFNIFVQKYFCHYNKGSKICTSFIRAEWHVSVECLAWLCPQTRVGQFLRDLLLKTMMTIQEDGNITDRSDYIKGDIILGAPNTPYIDGKITKQSQRDAHTQRCYRPEILGELGTKTPLSLSPCIEQKNSSVMQVFQESKSCSNCFYIVICCVSDPVLPLTSISKATFFFKWGYWAA